MSANSPFGCPECGRLSSAEQITALRAEVERLARSAQSWEAEALRYAQNAGHHEKRGAESRRLLEQAIANCRTCYGTGIERCGLCGDSTFDHYCTDAPCRSCAAARAHLAGGER